MRLHERWRDRRLWVELFCLGNLGFLAVDVLIAHAANDFAHPLEWLPVWFAAVGTGILVVAKLVGGRRADHVAGLSIGAASVVVGIAGLVLHLGDPFFARVTLHNLVYTAPFAAPLAFAGVGLLLMLGRMVPAGAREWGWWVLLLSLGGWIGNLALSLGDHAQNGFFDPWEWVPVAASALAVGFLVTPFLVRVERFYLRLCAGLMGVQALVGVLGFALHVVANLDRPGATWGERFLHGAPAFAPLLFADLALLSGIALWELAARDRDGAGVAPGA